MMKSIHYHIGALLLSGTCLGADLTFYLPFDGSPTAAVAKGNPEPLQAKGLEYDAGVAGQSVRLTARCRSG